MEIEGKIKVLKQEQVVNEKFKKREVVIITDETYPQSILVEFSQASCDLLDKFKVGDTVKVSINLRGREWINNQGETKYFNTIQGWKIDLVSSIIVPPIKKEEEVVEPLILEEDFDIPF